MVIQIIFKRFCIAFSLLMLLACGGGGGGSDSAPTPAPAPPTVYLAQNNVDFGGVVLDSSADQSVVIKNTGGSNLTIRSISSLSAPFSFAVDTCSNQTLAPSQTCSLKARFSPTSQGTFTAHFSVLSNADSVTIDLTGTGHGLNAWISGISASCASVSADVTVTNPRSNVPLTSFTASNFVLKQDGVTQTITSIQNYIPIHVSLVLALDWSTSTVNVVNNIQAAADDFIDRLTAGDEAAVSKFNGSNHIAFSPSTTPPYFTAGDAAGRASLITYIYDAFALSSGTPLYDAVMQSIDRAANGTAGNQRAVIVLTDGADDASGHTVDQVIAYAVQKGIPVFTIYYVDPNLSAYGRTDILQRLAKETGGQYYNSDTIDLTTIFQQISNVLSNKYTITYVPTTCSSGSTVTLNVDVQDGTGLEGQNTKTISFP